jgi:hypothetical protein
MKLEVKSVKVAGFASEETLCYQATVYVDGKPKFTAENRGQGGCSIFHPTKGGTWDDIKAAEAFCASLPNVESDLFPGEGFPVDLDYAVTTLVHRAQEIKWLRRRLAGKVWGEKGDGKICSWNYKPKPEHVAAIRAKFPEIPIINEMEIGDAYRAMTGDDLPSIAGVC